MKNTIAFLLFIVAINAFGQSQFKNTREQFTYEEHPIHPKLLYEFIPWVSDEKPVTISVDIAAAFQTNEYYEDFTSEKDGSVKFETEEDSFRYFWLGELDNGVHVVRTFNKMVGGSGIFEHLLFITLETNEFDLNGEKYTQSIMTLIKQYALGDRTNPKIKVRSNSVIIDNFFYTGKKKVIKF